MLIFLSHGCNLIMWYELNEKLRNILLLLPMSLHANRKPNMVVGSMMTSKNLLDMTSHENHLLSTQWSCKALWEVLHGKYSNNLGSHLLNASSDSEYSSF